jgi:hypothetical protein
MVYPLQQNVSLRDLNSIAGYVKDCATRHDEIKHCQFSEIMIAQTRNPGCRGFEDGEDVPAVAI